MATKTTTRRAPAKAATKPTGKGQPASVAAQKAAEAEEDYTKYADKAPTDLQKRFGEWILDKVDPEIENEEDFLEGVRLGVALRMKFQASPENQEVLAANRSKVATEDDDEEKPAPKRRGRPAKAVEPEPEEEPEEDDGLEDGEDEDEDEESEESEESVEETPAPTKTRGARGGTRGAPRTARAATKPAPRAKTSNKPAAPF